jgi:succinylglutamic semialdehyde dehydrogenase
MTGNYIDGKWTTGYGKTFSSINPTTKQVVWANASASASDVARAVKAAESAFDAWSSLKFSERARFLETYAQAVKESRDMLQLAISQETGKPLWEAKNEVNSIANKITISIEAYKQRCSEKTVPQTHATSVTRHHPHGVLAVLGPFNFPGHLPNGHIVPALLAGNTVVFKPSEFTPLVGELLIKCFEKASFPNGVINLVQGGAETGKALSTHEQINGLLFTGSLPTGLSLMKAFADKPGKILALELGGNNPLIVTDFEDETAAIYTTIQSAFLTTGQRCTCARRLILLKEKKHDAFLNRLIRTTRALTFGPYDAQPEPFMGPLIHERAVVKAILAQGAIEAGGGKPLLKMEQQGEESCFISPGLMDTTDLKEPWDEEIFAPFLQVIRVDNLEEAIKAANRTGYGLSAGLISRKKEEYDLFYRKIRAGVVNWNTPLTGASSEAPFGGIKNSGNNRPSALYAADYCAYPVASLESSTLSLPKSPAPGVDLGA